MANTYTQLYVQFVFAVKFREALIDVSWSSRLHHYITAIVQNNGHKMLAINTMPDHLHMLVGIDPKQSLSELIRLVKCDSSEWINKNKLTKQKFNWQSGYGAFSYTRSLVDTVVRYIMNQEQHHKKKSFVEEYKHILSKSRIAYNDDYIFTAPE